MSPKDFIGSGIDVCLMCHPYFPSKDTGRGVDRYAFELQQNIIKTHPGINLRILHNGFAQAVLKVGIKQLKFMAGLLFVKADLYHAASPMGGAPAALLGKSPLIVSIHDVIPYHVGGYDHAWKYAYKRFCTRLSVERSVAVIVPCRTTGAELSSLLNVPESKIHVVNYGIDHMEYYPRPGIARSERSVLYVGEVSRAKGVDALIRAFALVKEDIEDAELLIIGKRHRDQPLLERLCLDLGLRDVTFLGYIHEDLLPDYYCRASVMVFPSRYGFGLSTLEAMACGTPVIAGAVLDSPEFIGDAGILVDPEKPEELAVAVKRVLTEPGLKEKLSDSAVERAAEFSWERTAREIAYIYYSVKSVKQGL